MKKPFLLAAAIIFSFNTIAFCQNDNDILVHSVSKLKQFLNDHIIEKTYLQLDHPYPYYVAGDVVYFKAYVTMGELHQPSTISGILHVDLIDKNSTVIQTISVLLNNGIGWGDFNLPETLQKGSYRIRAYTDWMRNRKQPPFFEQYLSVSSSNNADRVTESTGAGIQPNLQFFPEGGNLVADIQSKVAFKAIGPNGLGIDFKGVIIDNSNQEVVKINPTHLGMGEFDLLPDQGKSYKAKITFANGSQSTVDLPTVEQKGMTLAVDNSNPNKISIEIKANRAYYKENLNKELNLIIYAGGAVRTVKTKLDNATLGLSLPSTTFHTGILQVTLLSQTGEPLNERLAFIQNNDQLDLNLSSDKQLFSKRENVSLNLHAKNKEGAAVNGSFSVSVIDESKILVDENAENSILPYLLLTSDLKGYIEKPNYYFANTNADTRKDLDVLMLSQGYRRFSWKQLLNDNSANEPAAFVPEKSFNITGTLKTKSGAPIADNKVTLIPATGGQPAITTTNAQGEFNFADMFFETGTRFILKPQAEKNTVITIDKPKDGPMVAPSAPIEATYNASADLLASLQNNQKAGPTTASTGAIQYNKVMAQIDTKKPTDKFNYRSSNLGGPGHADQVILSDQFKNAPSLSSGLNGVARDVQFISGVPYLPGSDVISAGGQIKESMLVVVDGAAVGNNTSIDSYNPNIVETVEILKRNNAAIYGIQGGAGVIVITTRQGVEKEENVTKEMSSGIFSISPVGLYKAKEFYVPAYGVNTGASGNLPDKRTTIFWKPDVSTDADGNASFNFYNADGTGTYRVLVEGIDKKGNLGRQVYRYKVQ